MSSNPNFNPTYSTDHIWRGDDMERCLSDDLNTIESDITALESGKASVSHIHTDYALATDLSELEVLVGDTSVSSQIASVAAGKADLNHTHSGYALEDHEHTDYASATSVASQISNAVATKADQSHSHILADLGIQYGRVTVSCTANTVSTGAVTFAKPYVSAPVVTLTAGSSAPGTSVMEVSVSDITTTGFNARVYRTNTSPTTIQWIAVGSLS